ncbi:hypothetical protein NtRootA4_36290 [Arthrobacter sp. NtRootA4]|nr:hypothetical protein NtRootA2_38500 [Arthrobacter sp. NtRootA2]BCW16650.1 hypothetical protein NtRootA4_36290 [Arthrobacter sp. NtRootA4]BCW24983.1 hypothetical protein NtRootC7_38500 [Arthrobacter sp. NtRootC7]BCW29252.1 hypothetical protein NtRootC45_38520 [Arthrobacter sp. NtRootC45]BCW33523.1 hypothetical protein NtRootD5_38540 [Arthrobacter sp. NtRootD5]
MVGRVQHYDVEAAELLNSAFHDVGGKAFVPRVAGQQEDPGTALADPFRRRLRVFFLFRR